jgi:hypothetical protein
MHNDDALDLLLNEALTTYAEPAAGLEQRIIARVERVGTDSSAPTLHRWPGWAVVLPLAACILLFFAMPNRQTESNQVSKSQRPQQNSIITTPTTPSQTLKQPPVHPPKHQSPSARLHTSSPSSVPVPAHKLEVFPTPQPLGPQEQALVQLASPAATPARQALLETKPQSDAPLEISAIRVPPISTPDEGKN